MCNRYICPVQASRHLTLKLFIQGHPWGAIVPDIADFKSAYISLIIVSPDESWGYLGFRTVTPLLLPLQRFPFGRDNLKNILVRPFKFGMWVYMGNVTNAIIL